MALSAAITSKINIYYNSCDFDTNIKLFSLFFDLSGAFYIFGATFVLPILSIVLVFQIKKVMHKSIKIRNTNKKDAAAAIRNVRIHLGQILIASYTFICLFPNILYFYSFTRYSSHVQYFLF